MASTRVFARGCGALMAAAKTSATASATATKPQVRQTGILKPVTVSPALAKFVGASEISRSEAVKKVWEYIKLNSLQNPVNKREICCDEKLKTIFDGKDNIGFLEIAKYMSTHFPKKS